MLIGELHGHPTAERLPDHRHPIDPQFPQQVTEERGERTQRVVAARFRRLPMTGQIRCDDPVSRGKGRKYRIPRLRTPRHPVDQQENLRTAPLVPICDMVAVQIHVFQCSH